MERNRQIRLISRPNGEPSESNFEMTEQPIIRPGKGEMLVRILFLSVDAYLRFYMGDVTPLIPPLPLNEVFGGSAVGEVIESNDAKFETGDIVLGNFGWQEYAIAKGDEVQRVDPEISPISSSLGLLGTTGLTAYFGMMEIGKPMAGETVVISGAAGAVGIAAGQIAKLKGCRVVGIAGSERKSRYLIEKIGFDAVVNYRSESNLKEELQKACPNGVDVYFDNVGGIVTHATLSLLNRYARVAVCGQISQYNKDSLDISSNIPFQIWKTSARIQGFMLYDYHHLFGEALDQMIQWYKEGKLNNYEHVIEGIDQAPVALMGLFKGENIGKVVVKLKHSIK